MECSPLGEPYESSLSRKRFSAESIGQVPPKAGHSSKTCSQLTSSNISLKRFASDSFDANVKGREEVK